MNLTKLTTITNLLGAEWTLEQRPEKVHDYMAKIFHRSSNAVLYINSNNRRWTISGLWPNRKDWRNFTIHQIDRDHPYSKITVNAERSGQAIARDIQRRFLPHYLDGLDKVNQYMTKLQQKQQQFEQMDAFLQQHIAIEHIQKSTWSTSYTLAHSKGQFTLSQQRETELTLTGLSIEQLLQIMQIVNTPKTNQSGTTQ